MRACKKVERFIIGSGLALSCSVVHINYWTSCSRRDSIHRIKKIRQAFSALSFSGLLQTSYFSSPPLFRLLTDSEFGNVCRNIKEKVFQDSSECKHETTSPFLACYEVDPSAAKTTRCIEISCRSSATTVRMIVFAPFTKKDESIRYPGR